MSDDEEMIGYKQQPGKLPFARPGSGGSEKFSELRDESRIPESQGGTLAQPQGPNRHDSLITGTAIGRRTPMVDSRWKVMGQAKYGDDIRLPGELFGRILRSPHHYARIMSRSRSNPRLRPC